MFQYSHYDRLNGSTGAACVADLSCCFQSRLGPSPNCPRLPSRPQRRLRVHGWLHRARDARRPNASLRSRVSLPFRGNLEYTVDWLPTIVLTKPKVVYGAGAAPHSVCDGLPGHLRLHPYGKLVMGGVLSTGNIPPRDTLRPSTRVTSFVLVDWMPPFLGVVGLSSDNSSLTPSLTFYRPVPLVPAPRCSLSNQTHVAYRLNFREYTTHSGSRTPSPP